jgi:Cu(I)/Ag(I) efflux system membrane fusion protein
MNRIAITATVAIALGIALCTGYWLGSRQVPAVATTSVAADAKRPMYWYDPMKPETHFDKPGKSPFMDMQLVPKYADAEVAGSVRVDPATMQNLGMRTALVETGVITRSAHVPGTIGWDLREARVVSARADGVIERLYVRAPFERVKAGQPLAELIAPDWNAAAQEYLALGNAHSTDARELRIAAGERLHALGMDDAQIRGLGRGGSRIVLRAPADGVVSTLDVREGQRVNAGMPIMTLNGSRSVWLEAAIPQAQSAGIVAGTPVKATVSAWPGRTFSGRIEAMLPEVDASTRTQRARIVLDNTGGDLAPGMFAELQLQSAAGHVYPLVPDEALIETGDAARVIVAEDGGHYRPVAVRTGASSGGKTEILAGLKGGERVVVSGQFLIDSEASLSGALERLPQAPDAKAQEPQP